jgi:hypothetical protein
MRDGIHHRHWRITIMTQRREHIKLKQLNFSNQK